MDERDDAVAPVKQPSLAGKTSEGKASPARKASALPSKEILEQDKNELQLQVGKENVVPDDAVLDNGAGAVLPATAKAGDIHAETEKLARLDDLMEGSKEQQILALNQLLSAVQEGDRRDPNLLWRLCKAQFLCSVLENQDDNKEGQHKLIMEAINSGEEALGLDSKNSEAHKWFAIALGSRGEFGGVKEKILDGFEFKKHIDMAAEFNPKDHFTQHLLGRFCYEVSQVSPNS